APRQRPTRLSCARPHARLPRRLPRGPARRGAEHLRAPRAAAAEHGGRNPRRLADNGSEPAPSLLPARKGQEARCGRGGKGTGMAAIGERTVPARRPGGDRGTVTVDAAALAAALRARTSSEVRFDAGDQALYATDASNFRQVP